MHTRLLGPAAILFLATALGCGGAGRNGSRSSDSPARAPSVEPVTAVEANARVAAGTAVLVDVRESGEIAAGMAAPAVWMPTSRIGGEAWERFVAGTPKDRQVIFYCAVGSRSQQAALRLSALAYRTGNMGGFGGWVKAGLPVRIPSE